MVIDADHGETLYDHECFFDHHGLYDVHAARPAGVRPARARCRPAGASATTAR